MKSINIKRKLIQIAAFGFTNFHIGNFAKGQIYNGKWKQFCSPGLNCYSCPAANLACPIGAMQSVASSSMKFSFYVVGILLAIGVVLGRGVCGYLCPFGLLQELLFKIKSPKIKIPKFLTWTKYVILVLFVIVLPALWVSSLGIAKPWFCEYICPVGTLEAGIPLLLVNAGLRNIIGPIFFLKLGILIAVIVLSIVCYRFFCKVMCPLGAIYGLLNKVSLLHIECDKRKCSNCGLCSKACGMDVNPVLNSRSPECILCGKCVGVCEREALRLTMIDKKDVNKDIDIKDSKSLENNI